ncbi:prevent-host-death family protein [Mesorhizobium albiziae]|uniref:Antitoxin n=1 Tax=Neomesorhizobium albiziae TaxID=335020 RepID=A0A1I4BXE5_9HYPH|nr:type II toxin-antitoxin system prevent-host-death family antitoxin [Mesorhizobium albiziae]SFK73478.1 prevent-host-death family protein [Mesorhizobium albiziae]
MAVINMHQAKTELSDLVARAEAGEEIVIARRNKPAVKLVPVEDAVGDLKGKRRPGVLAELLEPEALALLREATKDIDWFEHAPDEYISKTDIAAYYRKYPHEWDEMRSMVGFAEDKQAEYDAAALRQAVEAGREFTIMRDGKPVAKVVPVGPEPKSRGWGAWEGRYQLPDSYFDPLPEEELRAWDGSDEPPA